MNWHLIFIKFFALFVLLGLIFGTYWLVFRPGQLHWGATEEEIARPMPGDELDPNPTFLATRAITIQGTPEEIWPWLLQMGYGRAGYYGYDVFENLGSPAGLYSPDHIMPELQNFKVGDKVPIFPGTEQVFSAIQPNSYLIWAGQGKQNPGGFTWALYPIDATNTRLVSRIRWTHHSIAQPGIASLDLITEFTDHLAIRKILQGVKGRVEGHNEPFAATTAEFAVYLAALLIYIASLVLIMFRPFSWQGWLVGLAAGIGWLVLWYAPIPAWSGVILELLILFNLVRTFR